LVPADLIDLAVIDFFLHELDVLPSGLVQLLVPEVKLELVDYYRLAVRQTRNHQ